MSEQQVLVEGRESCKCWWKGEKVAGHEQWIGMRREIGDVGRNREQAKGENC